VSPVFGVAEPVSWAWIASSNSAWRFGHHRYTVVFATPERATTASIVKRATPSSRSTSRAARMTSCVAFSLRVRAIATRG
jgi:hypothetical protein